MSRSANKILLEEPRIRGNVSEEEWQKMLRAAHSQLYNAKWLKGYQWFNKHLYP